MGDDFLSAELGKAVKQATARKKRSKRKSNATRVHINTAVIPSTRLSGAVTDKTADSLAALGVTAFDPQAVERNVMKQVDAAIEEEEDRVHRERMEEIDAELAKIDRYLFENPLNQAHGAARRNLEISRKRKERRVTELNNNKMILTAVYKKRKRDREEERASGSGGSGTAVSREELIRTGKLTPFDNMAGKERLTVGGERRPSITELRSRMQPDSHAALAEATSKIRIPTKPSFMGPDGTPAAQSGNSLKAKAAKAARIAAEKRAAASGGGGGGGGGGKRAKRKRSDSSGGGGSKGEAAAKRSRKETDRERDDGNIEAYYRRIRKTKGNSRRAARAPPSKETPDPKLAAMFGEDADMGGYTDDDSSEGGGAVKREGGRDGGGGRESGSDSGVVEIGSRRKKSNGRGRGSGNGASNAISLDNSGDDSAANALSLSDDSDSEYEAAIEFSPSVDDVQFDGGYRIPRWIWRQLYGYQKTGIKWLWELHSQAAGGIVGDEMGLGKTVQIAAFLGGLSLSGLFDSALIVCPATVMRHWVSELHKWWPPLRVLMLHDLCPVHTQQV